MQAKKGQYVDTPKKHHVHAQGTSSDVIPILSKSLAAYHPNGRHKINSSNDNEEHNPGQTECEHEMYDQLDKTQTFQVANSFVSFTRTF
jgi:hypothetical protein